MYVKQISVFIENTPGRLERKKYNPFLKRVTVHREIK